MKLTQEQLMASVKGMDNWLKDSDIDSILLANKDIPFVKKIMDKDTTSIQITNVKGRSTHFMEQSDNIVYPTVQEVDGKLQYLGDKAREYALKVGNYIEFKNEKEAMWFSENYKNSKFWKSYEKFAGY